MLLYVDAMLVVGSNVQEINVLKGKLENSFSIKDMCSARQILDMRITRDRKNHKLTLSRREDIEKVLEKFNMQNAKLVSTRLASHFKLSKICIPRLNKRWIICVNFRMY